MMLQVVLASHVIIILMTKEASMIVILIALEKIYGRGVTYDHRLQSSLTIITYDHHLQSSLMINTYDHHL